MQLLERERGLRCSTLAFRTTAGFYGRAGHPHASVVSDWNKRIQTEETNRKAKEEAAERRIQAEAAKKKAEQGGGEKKPKEKKAKKAKKERAKAPPPG